MEVSLSLLDANSIKLIVWDLDNTFWTGILSESEVRVNDQAVLLLKESSRRGIVNSICSKNTFSQVEHKLKSLGLWDLFVFPSIDWTPKQDRLFNIIEDMGLRPANVLFLDDEPYNLAAASAKDDTIKCARLDDSVCLFIEKLNTLPVDNSYKRLKQYRDLQKRNDVKHTFKDDKDFLRSSDIRIRIGKDCNNHKARIFELINRTNQLNFTKKRLSADEINSLLGDQSSDCGYIEVRDRFCDYGIVGFYALKGDRLDHYLFSCRTIGMGIEQYVYAQLQFPDVVVQGEVITELNRTDCPDWITLCDRFDDIKGDNHNKKLRILLKGPCDVSQVLPFFKDSSCFSTEFSYVSKTKHTYIEAQNHLSQVFLTSILSEKDKIILEESLPFIDNEYFKSDIIKGHYDYVILSLLPDYGLGLYRNKYNPNIVLPFNQFTIDYTIRDNWFDIMRLQSDWPDSLIENSFHVFHDNYEFIGRESDESLINSLTELRNILPDSTILVLVNGSEYEFNGHVKPGYDNRHLLHKHLNGLVLSFADKYDNVRVLDVNKCIRGSEDYLDTINHFKKVVYYRMAQDIQSILNESSNDNSVEVRNRLAVIHDIAISKYSKIKGKGYYLYSKVKKYLKDK